MRGEIENQLSKMDDVEFRELEIRIFYSRMLRDLENLKPKPEIYETINLSLEDYQRARNCAFNFDIRTLSKVEKYRECVQIEQND